ncbi:hypothetical protein GWK47_048151 [Chionoecetes opilio]|uniref:Uncharacterized protein n=1 Tax=Chionoecetes opilio TaxID=41210 RepID=A0A8J5CUL0_CHIOP|nr:hypothetical protein GWK47_048151 [Chionoecetes opilio]
MFARSGEQTLCSPCYKNKDAVIRHTPPGCGASKACARPLGDHKLSMQTEETQAGGNGSPANAEVPYLCVQQRWQADPKTCVGGVSCEGRVRRVLAREEYIKGCVVLLWFMLCFVCVSPFLPSIGATGRWPRQRTEQMPSPTGRLRRELDCAGSVPPALKSIHP